MMRARSFLVRLRGNRRGATIVELGFVAMPLTFLLLTVFEMGYRAYYNAVIEGTLHAAARIASVGNKTPTQIDDFIKGRLKNFSSKATVTIEKKSYYDFSSVGKPEKIKQDTAPFGQYNVGDCYEDSNGNNVYDTSAGSTGMGGSDDVVYYKVTAQFPRIIPMGFMGWSEKETISQNVVLRNQPYASQTVPKVKCD